MRKEIPILGSEMLEVAIGLVFVYLVLSLICTAINEVIASVLALRAKTLEAGIKNLLSDEDGEVLAIEFFDNHLVRGLAKQGRLDRFLDWLPKVERKGQFSYIDPRTFALALMEAVTETSANDGDSRKLDDVRTAVGKLPESDLRKTLLFLIHEADGDLKKARENIENWFNEGMERVSGWYKRKMQIVTVILAFLVTVPLNADTLMIYNSVSRNVTLRAAVVQAAEELVKTETGEPERSTTGAPDTPQDRIERLGEQLEKLELMGWSADPDHPRGVPGDIYGWLMKAVGLLLTTAAVSLGAPFWFDVLSKFMNIRTTGKRPEEEDASGKRPKRHGGAQEEGERAMTG